MADLKEKELPKTEQEAPGLPAVPYDFRSPSRVPKEQTTTVKLIHETFAITGANGISAYLDSEFTLQLEQLEQITFQEYILGLSNPSCVCTFDMQPLNGYGVLELNAPLVYVMIDKMLGGDGEIPNVARSFTELELAIIRKLMNLFLKELSLAWAYVLNIKFGCRDIQTNPSFVRVISQREPCLVATMKAKIGSKSGLVTVCLPYVNLEPVSAKLGNEHLNNRYVTKPTEELQEAHRRNFSQVKLDITAVLGSLQLSSTELLALEPGDILDLDRKTRQPIELRVAGTPKFLASPGLVGKYKGAMIHSEIVKD